MDKTVIILIGAGVCCMVIGFSLFIKLCTSSKKSDDVADKKLLDEEYMENFKECFENTGSIEDTLEELANIYTGNQYMYNLIVNSLEYIRDEQGDYETALEKINVDSDIAVMKLHNMAIKKSLNLEVNKKESLDTNDVAVIEAAIDEEFDEDVEDEEVVTKNKPDDDNDDYEDDEDDDLDDFKIG